MITWRRWAFLLLVALAVPAIVATQTVNPNRAIAPLPTTLQNAVTANGNGTALTVSGYATVLLDVTCATCSGGTLVNFEESADGSTFTATQALKRGTPTIASSTTSTGMWQLPVGGTITAIRARVSAYSAGTVTVKAYPSILAPSPLITSAADTGSFVQTFGSYLPVGGVNWDVITNLTNNQGGAVAMTDTRSFHVSLFSNLGAALIGQQTMAVSVPVVIASNQTSFPVTVAAGSAVIGHVITDTTSTTAVTQATGTNLHAVIDTGSTTAVTQATGTNLHAVIDTGSTTAVTQGTAANLNATVVGTGTFATQSILTTGSAQIGHLEANQSSNVAQINGVTPLMGNGASGTGAQRVTLANDSTGIIASIGTSVVAGTSATHLGKAEDAAHSSGDTGVFILGVANEANAQLAGTDGDYTVIKTDRTGQLFTDRCPSAAMVRGTATTTGTSDTSLVAASGSGSLKTYVYSAQIVNTGSTAALITFKDGSGGSTLGYTIAPASGSGSNIVFEVPLVTTANTAFYFAAGSSSTTVYASAQGCKAP